MAQYLYFTIARDQSLYRILQRYTQRFVFFNLRGGPCPRGAPSVTLFRVSFSWKTARTKEILGVGEGWGARAIVGQAPQPSSIPKISLVRAVSQPFLMQILLLKTPYKLKNRMAVHTLKPQTAHDAPWLHGPSLKKTVSKFGTKFSTTIWVCTHIMYPRILLEYSSGTAEGVWAPGISGGFWRASPIFPKSNSKSGTVHAGVDAVEQAPAISQPFIRHQDLVGLAHFHVGVLP
jgi:hypothetical protein